LVLGWRHLYENLRFYFTAKVVVYISTTCDRTAVFASTKFCDIGSEARLNFRGGEGV